MRCLYCGKQLALFRRLTGGGEFCSDAHKASYHDEFNRLALARLKQAQEKSDELRAAAPQNQLALIRRVPGEQQPEAPSIRSNAHWIDPKPSRPAQRRPLAIAAPAAAAPPAEPPAPKEGGFIQEMAKPAKPALPPDPDRPFERHASLVPTAMPAWDPPIARLEEAVPEWGRHLESTMPAPARLAPEQDLSASSIPVAAAIESVKPQWNPPLSHAQVQLPAAEAIAGAVAPVARPTAAAEGVFVEPEVGVTGVQPRLPAVIAWQSPFAAYPPLPAVAIDPLRFAPAFEVQVELWSQGLDFSFEYTAFPAPDFDILEPGETPAPEMRLRKRPTIERTEPAHVLDPPVEIVRRKAAGSPQALGLGTIGEIAAVVTPVKSLQPAAVAPPDRQVSDPFLTHPPATMVPRSAALGFRPEEQDRDDKRPSALKMKLAAMATLPPTDHPPLEPPPIAESKPAVPASRLPERKPVERSAPKPPPLSSPPRRRTVPIPSILDPQTDAGEEQKSLWSALRKYLGK
jgi:hypothetical protein